MNNEQNRMVKSPPVQSSRRTFIKYIASVGLLGLLGVNIIYSKFRPKKDLYYPKSLTILGPFQKYGFFSIDELIFEDTYDNNASDFSLISLNLIEGENSDAVQITFTCNGGEKSDIEMRVSLSAITKDGLNAGFESNLFRDPRIADSHGLQFNEISPLPFALLDIPLRNARISQLKAIHISTERIS